jgi:zinc transporter 1/2/3
VGVVLDVYVRSESREVGMSLAEWKVVFSVAVFATGILGVLLPWALGRGASSPRFMAWGDTFAGGVLGGAGLMHLLSDGTNGFRAVLPGLEYPLGFALAGAGFLLILLIEAVVATGPDLGEPALPCGAGGASHEIGPGTRPPERHPYSFILLLVLSVHSLIIGMALGAQRSLTTALAIFIAIMAHKGMAGFALGVSYRRTGTSLRRGAPVAAFFACMTPVGILASTAVDTLISATSRELFEAVFNSVGAGTFLYIATLDILRTEFELPGDNWQKWLLATAGFSIMAVLAIWI